LKENLANIMMKGLDKGQHDYLKKKLGFLWIFRWGGVLRMYYIRLLESSRIWDTITQYSSS
jgi:hypothetical protein